MASDRLAELLLERSEFTEEEIEQMTESEAWNWIHASESMQEKPDDILYENKNI